MIDFDVNTFKQQTIGFIEEDLFSLGDPHTTEAMFREKVYFGGCKFDLLQRKTPYLKEKRFERFI